jgi:acyl carrier protein
MIEPSGPVTAPHPTPEYLTLVREFLPELAADEPLEPDVPLQQYGLDSMTSISLMLALEETLDLTFPEELLSPESFSTTATLWNTVTEIRRGQS